MIRILAVLTILFSTNYVCAGDFPKNVQIVYNPTWLGELDSNEVLEGIRLAKQDFEDACEINLSLTTNGDNARRPYVMIGQGYQYPAAGWTFGSTKYNRNAVIFLNSWDPRGWTIDKVRKIVRHELGHALLEMPHSNFTSDVMHPYASAEWWSPYEVGLLQFEFGPKYVIPSYIYDEIEELTELRKLITQGESSIERNTRSIRRNIELRANYREIILNSRLAIQRYRDSGNQDMIKFHQSRIANSLLMIQTFNQRINISSIERNKLSEEIEELKLKVINIQSYIDKEIDKYN